MQSRSKLAYNLGFIPVPPAMNMFTLALLVLTPLLVWRIYSRLKGMVMRQRSIIARHWTGLALFGAVIVVVGSEVIRSPEQLGWLAVGVAGGVGYGIWGLRLTRLEATEQGMYFTPHARLGIVAAMVLSARILYLGFDMYVNQGTGTAMPRFTDSPLTVLVLGFASAYYVSYNAGLLRWRYRSKG
jgi:hypothetical protein